jgi:cytochrome c553
VGHSPSYLVRQLQDMQPETRKRIWTDPMRAVAGELTDEEMIAIGADLA